MKKLWNQAIGREPESTWMSEAGAFIVMLVLPVVLVIAYVACGGGI